MQRPWPVRHVRNGLAPGIPIPLCYYVSQYRPRPTVAGRVWDSGGNPCAVLWRACASTTGGGGFVKDDVSSTKNFLSFHITVRHPCVTTCFACCHALRRILHMLSHGFSVRREDGGACRDPFTLGRSLFTCSSTHELLGKSVYTNCKGKETELAAPLYDPSQDYCFTDKDNNNKYCGYLSSLSCSVKPKCWLGKSMYTNCEGTETELEPVHSHQIRFYLTIQLSRTSSYISFFFGSLPSVILYFVDYCTSVSCFRS